MSYTSTGGLPTIPRLAVAGVDEGAPDTVVTSGAAGSLTSLTLPTQAVAPAVPASGVVLYANSSGRLSWRSASDTFSRSIIVTATANRTFTAPDADFTFAGQNLANTFTLANTFSANGALSAPAVSFTGTPITGGTASTTAPLVKIGSGADGEYSTSGNMCVVNAPSAYAGYLQQWLVNGSQRVVIDSISGTAGRINISRRSSTTLTGTIHGVDYLGAGDGLQLNFSGGSTSRLALESGQIQINGNFVTQSGNTIGWSDVFLSRKAAANVQLGAADAAAPVAQKLSRQSVVAGTSNTAGVLFTDVASLGTGTGDPGSIGRQTGIRNATGTVQHTPGWRDFIAGKDTTLTEATATTLFTVTVGTGKYLGMIVECTVFASDGTDFQALHSTLRINTGNKAGTIGTTGIMQTDCATPYNSAGTLTPVTYTLVDNGSGVLAVKCAATSSLTQTTLTCKYQITAINSSDAITITPA